jgi:co-chaperonin GroES (HSP10)
MSTPTLPYSVRDILPDAVTLLDAPDGNENPEYFYGETNIDFIPMENCVVVYTPPVEKRSEAGLHLDMVDSLDASLPVRGTVVARGPWTQDAYGLGADVLVRRYVGTQMVVDGDDNYWYFDLSQGHVLGRFLPPLDFAVSDDTPDNDPEETDAE